jgi:hypothetical protein
VKQKEKIGNEITTYFTENDYLVDLSIVGCGRLVVAGPKEKFVERMTKEMLAELKSKPGRKDSAYR